MMFLFCKVCKILCLPVFQ